MKTQTTKNCSKCNQTLTLDNFYKQKTSSDGLLPHCKKCHNKLTKKAGVKLAKENPYEYIIQNRYKSLNQRCINGKYTTSPSAVSCPQLKSYRDKGIELLMSYETFREWMLANEGVHNEIVARGEKSSIDRIDETLGYSIDNIQLISLHKNIEKRFGKKCEYQSENKKEQKKMENKIAYKRSRQK